MSTYENLANVGSRCHGVRVGLSSSSKIAVRMHDAGLELDFIKKVCSLAIYDLQGFELMQLWFEVDDDQERAGYVEDLRNLVKSREV